MKANLFILLALCNVGALVGQTLPMQTLNVTQCNVHAQIPAFYTTSVDTLGLKMYSSLTEDSLIGAQLFIYDNYSLDSNDVLKEYMQTYNETDTLKTIAKFMVTNSGGTLVYFQINENYISSKSMDVGINYTDQNTSFVSFTRMILKGKRMIILNVYAQECHLSQLLIAKNTCYNGLFVY